MNTDAIRTDSHKIWINPHYYLHVDSEGYIVGTCYEGALGCVVPLLSSSDGNRLALKLPRMLADTVRENAFISQVVHGESMIVFRANEEFKATSGLIPVQAFGRDVLRGVRELRNAPSTDARKQDGCILLFSFRKERNFRVCAVRFDDDRRVVFPPDAEQDLGFLTRGLWERALAAACNSEDREASSYYLEVPRSRTRDTSSEVVHATLMTTTASHEWSDVWFGALPSILYNWASGTLQEAVSQGRLMSWSLERHYELSCRVLRGIETLHSKGFIHGDLRPANIMTCGIANLPEDYVVGDYGSFADDLSQLGNPSTAESGHTVVGGLGRHRTSLFYAPERRAGVERETADVALVLSTLDDVNVNDEYLIYFGWRSQVIASKSHDRVQERLLSTLRSDWRRMLEARRDEPRPLVSGDRLAPNDRLRVRDFIFTIIDAEEFDESDDHAPAHDSNKPEPSSQSPGRRFVVRCRRRFATVLHERLTVYDNGPGLPDCTVVGIPNYVELRQWSVATDLYGVGALILYTVFMTGLQKGHVSSLAFRARRRVDAMTNSETLLSQMLEVLEGIPSFLALWSDLEDFVWNIENPEHVGLSGADLARVEIRLRPGALQDESGRDGGPTLNSTSEKRTLASFALRTVNNLLRSVPHIGHVLDAFQCDEGGRSEGTRVRSSYNAAHFLLFVHFVMACLHRRSHLRAVGEAELNYPFCRDRCESPGPQGPAMRALARLEELKRRLLQPRYDAIIVHDKQLVNFDPRDVMQIRIEHAQFGRELAARRQEVIELQQQLVDARTERAELARAQSSAIERADLALREATASMAVAESLRKELAGVHAEAKRLREAHERLKVERQQIWQSSVEADTTAQRRCEEFELEVSRLNSLLRETEGARKALAGERAEIDQKMHEVQRAMDSSMSECLGHLAEIAQVGWRLPRDRLERLTAALTVWREWGKRTNVTT